MIQGIIPDVTKWNSGEGETNPRPGPHPVLGLDLDDEIIGTNKIVEQAYID